MGRYFKAMMFGLLLVASMPLVASAIATPGVPLLDCRLDYQEYTAPGLVGDATDEDIYLYCKNKGDATLGDATAYNVTVTVVSPAYAPVVYTAVVGDVLVDGSFYNRIDMAVDETAPVGAKFEVEATVNYNDVTPTAMEPTIVTANIKVLKMPDITVIGDHRGPAIFAPGGQVIYAKTSDYALYSWDIATGTEVVIAQSGGTWYHNSHPALSPNGKKIAFQRRTQVTDRAEIWVMNLDGTDAELVIGDTSGVFYWMAPLWVNNQTLLIRADRSAPEPSSWWTIKTDGSDLEQVTPTGSEYTPFADVTMIDGVPFALFQLDSSVAVPTTEVYNLKTGNLVLTVDGVLETGMGEFRPGSASLVYKDDWPNTGDLWVTTLKGVKRPLTLRKAVKEFQVSVDADTIALDQDDILEVLRVVRADAPNGPTYDVAPFDFQQDDNTIDLLDPLSGSTPGLRTGVFVTYLYAEGDSNCYAKPHWAKSGNFMVYQYDFGSIQDAWAMGPTGKGKIRLTFDDEMSSSDSRGMPLIKGGLMLISNDGTLELVDLAANLGDRFDGGDGGSDDQCGAVPGPVPAWWIMLSLLAPLAAGFGIRRFARR